MPSVLIVEDHVMVSRMMSRLLRERGNIEVWSIVATAEAALEVLAAAGDCAKGHSENGLSKKGRAEKGHAAHNNPPENCHLPDLVLADISLPGMNGLEMVAEIKRRYPELPCLIVSASHYADNVRKALDKGARGYVAKGNPMAVLEGVRSVLRGEIYLSEEVQDALDA
jgi:DNA-binding NarL/FixJ family response regulator